MTNYVQTMRPAHTFHSIYSTRNKFTQASFKQTVMVCTMLSMLASAPSMAAPAYPGAADTQGGTVLNASIATIPATPTQPVAIPVAQGIAATEAPALGEPDSSPALYNARVELETDSSPALFANRVELETNEATPAITPAVDKVMPNPDAAPATITTAANTAAPLVQAGLGEPDNSPSLFESRKELAPQQDANKISNVLTSFMKPVSPAVDDATKVADAAEGKPVASYQSPGIVVKKQHHAQTEYQPNLENNNVQLASLVPASGETAQDSGPLIQLPAPDMSNKPAPVAIPVAKPQIEVKPEATVAVESSEPRRELSPASKAILRKIPANIDTPTTKTSGPIAIDRAKDAANSTIAASTSVKHEEMGIKIEVKEPTLDLTYELEKAYNATIAGQTSIAMDIYKNILSNDPKNKGALFGLGTLYHRAGQIDTARKLYSKLLSIDPSNRDALNNFLVLLADEAPEAALEQLARLEQRDPKFSPIPAQMAIIYQKMGNMDMASEKMFRAVDLSPENLVYRYNLAIMLDKQKKYDEAGRLYHQIVQAYQRGQDVPGNISQIQQRLTFISSNKN